MHWPLCVSKRADEDGRANEPPVSIRSGQPAGQPLRALAGRRLTVGPGWKPASAEPSDGRQWPPPLLELELSLRLALLRPLSLLLEAPSSSSCSPPPTSTCNSDQVARLWRFPCQPAATAWDGQPAGSHEQVRAKPRSHSRGAATGTAPSFLFVRVAPARRQSGGVGERKQTSCCLQAALADQPEGGGGGVCRN